MKRKVALISPSETPETFIQAQIDTLNAEVFHLYGADYLPKYAKNYGYLAPNYNIFTLLTKKIQKIYFNKAQEPLHVDGLKLYLQKKKIEVVIAYFGMVGAELSPILQELEIPLIVHFLGHDATRIPILKTFSSRYKEMFQYAKFLVVVSKDMKQQLIKLGAPEHKIVLNPCGASKEYADLKVNYNSNNFLSVGRFVDKKAPYLTLLAFEYLHRKYPEAKLTMIGEDYLLNSVKVLAEVLNLSDSVSFLGRQTPAQIKECMQDSFCYVQHSIVADDGDSEGTPVIILEAQAAGLPVVSTLHAGIKEAVVHSETGFLVAEKNIKEMSKYMIELYENRELAKQMGIRAREFVYQNYSNEENINTLNKLIEDSLK